jgi:hypothetical protein
MDRYVAYDQTSVFGFWCLCVVSHWMRFVFKSTKNTDSVAVTANSLDCEANAIPRWELSGSRVGDRHTHISKS